MLQVKFTSQIKEIMLQVKFGHFHVKRGGKNGKIFF